MSTIYQRNMNRINPDKIDNIFDTLKKCFIPPDPLNRDYKAVLDYCEQLKITPMDLDPFTG